MGRGRGGYTGYETCYRDSGGNKVTDKGSIFVAERYIDQGYEAVFKQTHNPSKTCDLVIKTSDDSSIVKHIEVKQVQSRNPSQLAKNIKDGFTHFTDGTTETVAIFLPHHTNSETGRKFAEAGFAEAMRRGWIKGHVEVWFGDKTKIDMN